MRKIVPLGDNVLVKLEQEESKTKGGIFLPDSSIGEKGEGVVIGVAKDRPSLVNIGDTVLFGTYSGHDVMIGGKKHKFILKTELLGVYEEE